MKNKKRTFVLFCALQITYWSCFACFMSYFSAFMLANGMSSTVLSLILSLYLLAAFLGSFFWGSLSDKLGTNRKTFMMQISLMLLSGIIIYRFAHITVLVAILYPFLGFATVPIASNLDSWIIKSFPENPNYYGISRGMSAVGFGVLALLMGQLVNSVGYIVMPIGLSIFAILSLVIALIQPDSPQSMVGTRAKFSFKDMGTLFKNRPYVTLLIILFLTGLTVVPVSNMKIVLYQSVGGDVRWVGYDSFIGCMIQFPIFLLAGKLTHVRASFRLVISLLFIMLLPVIYYLGQVPFVMIFGSAGYFVGYSILLPTYRELGGKLVRPEFMTTGQSLLDSVFASLAGMTGLLYSGYVIDNFGIKRLILIGLFIFIVPLVMVIVQWIKSARS